MFLWFMTGASLGSFVCCAAQGIRRRENWVTRRSHCDACGAKLSPAELIPVFSYLIRKGRCRHCGAVIPAHLFFAELFGGILFLILHCLYW